MAQQRANQEHNDYLRTGSMREYDQWQAAQRRAQEEYRQYQMAAGRYGNGYYNVTATITTATTMAIPTTIWQRR